MYKILSYLILFFFLLFSCKEQTVPRLNISHTPSQLKLQVSAFPKGIKKVADNVYVAVGYGLANSIMIEGRDSVIIIDAMESNQRAQLVKDEFLKITNKPVKAIIYTHNHGDHVFGAVALAAGSKPDVYAHDLTNYYLDRVMTQIRPVISKRSYRMHGIVLDDDALVNCGIGHRLEHGKDADLGLIRPTITYKDSLHVNISGVELVLYYAPGETDDQTMIWYPEKNILFCGDNLYKSFPNLYTIRGTAYRDPLKWVSSIDHMRDLKPQILVPSHTLPITGSDSVQKTLIDYRDAIQYVHDQTVRGMNMGLTPDELADNIHLPEHLARSPYLQEFYGKVHWCVKNIFIGYLGYFDGKPGTLLPLSPADKAKEIALISGGNEALLKQAQKALKDKKHQWALELSAYLKSLPVDQEMVKQIRIEALTNLGSLQSNPNARHYFLTCAMEEKGLDLHKEVNIKPEVLKTIPLKAIFNSLTVSLDPVASAAVVKNVCFKFSDTDEVFSLLVRKGVAELKYKRIGTPDIIVEMNSQVWKEILVKLRDPLIAFAKGEIKVEGSKTELISFMQLFKAAEDIES
ncbi:MAG TPA: MBL fold metallo-hydrolase [Bacteroidetes bacterium]|nr:MBL fold metallo-hydrolase [Bacteroidota bacterium]